MAKGSSFLRIPLICVYGEPVQGSIPAMPSFVLARAVNGPIAGGRPRNARLNAPATLAESANGVLRTRGNAGFGTRASSQPLSPIEMKLAFRNRHCRGSVEPRLLTQRESLVRLIWRYAACRRR